MWRPYLGFLLVFCASSAAAQDIDHIKADIVDYMEACETLGSNRVVFEDDLLVIRADPFGNGLNGIVAIRLDQLASIRQPGGIEFTCAGSPCIAEAPIEAYGNGRMRNRYTFINCSFNELSELGVKFSRLMSAYGGEDPDYQD